jgi:hypothetical protein
MGPPNSPLCLYHSDCPLLRIEKVRVRFRASFRAESVMHFYIEFAVVTAGRTTLYAGSMRKTG